MALDLSGRSDNEIRLAYGSLGLNPERFASNPEYANAIRLEYDRRFRSSQPSAPAVPDNVQADLDASASPLTPEAEVRSAPVNSEKARLLEGVPAEFQSRLPGETMDEYGARYGASIRAGFDASDAEYAARKRAGYKHPDRVQMEAEWLADNPEPMSSAFVRQDEGSAYSPMTNFQSGSTVTVDGVEVPAVDLGDGQLRYRLGDVKRAQEAAQEAKWLAGHRQMVADEKERLGLHLPVMMRSPEQVANLHRQRDAEAAPLAARERSRAYQIAHANDPKTPYEQRMADRRAKLSAMSEIAGGSQNINSGNRDFFRALATLSPQERNDAQRQMMPMNPVRAQVDAQQMANLNQFARQFGTAGFGGMFGNDPQGAIRELQAAQAEAQLPPDVQAQRNAGSPEVHPAELTVADEYVAAHYSAPRGVMGNSSDFTLAEQQATVDHLVRNRGYDLDKAQRIVDEIARRRNASSWAGNTVREPAPAE